MVYVGLEKLICADYFVVKNAIKTVPTLFPYHMTYSKVSNRRVYSLINFQDICRPTYLSYIFYLPCGPSIMDYPETSGNLRKLAVEVSGRFPAGFQIFY